MSFDTTGDQPTRAWLIAFFVGAIFLGGVWLGKITLPLSVLILPVLYCDRSQFSFRMPIAAVPLMVLGAVIAIQFGLYIGNPNFRWKSDLAVWLPPVFAGLTIIALRGAWLPERLVFRSMTIGGALTAAIMVGMMLFAPKGVFLLPGQNAAGVEASYAQRMAEAVQPSADVPSPAAVAQDPSEPAVVAPTPTAESPPAGREAFTSDKGDQGFYDLKNRARNFLGLSNYIAVFMSFLFAVALFSGRPLIATSFAFFAAVTLSRFGIAMLVVIGAIYLLRTRLDPRKGAIWAAGLCALGLMGMYLFRGSIPHIPGMASLSARFEYWRSGIEALSLHPILGAPRSVYLVELGNSITWNPHNSILWIVINFGLIGLVAYGAYVWIALRDVARAASFSPVWSGVFVGLVVTLAWSLEEIIVLTPAFEILLASMYGLARFARRS